MRGLLFFLILIYSFSYSNQKPSSNNLDINAYFENLNERNSVDINYNEKFNVTLKSLKKSIETNDSIAQMNQRFELGKLYFEIKRYDDAINSFKTNISLPKSFQNNFIQAQTNYFLSVCYNKKKEYDRAIGYINRTESILWFLKNSKNQNLIHLQKGISYK